MQVPVVAYREPAGRYNKLLEVQYVCEHNTRYLYIRAPYTRIMVFWHTSNMPP